MRKGQRPTQIIYPNPLVCWELTVTISAPVAPSRGLTTRARPIPLLGRSLTAQSCRVIISRVLSWSTRLIKRLSGTQVHLYRGGTACPFSPAVTVNEEQLKVTVCPYHQGELRGITLGRFTPKVECQGELGGITLDRFTLQVLHDRDIIGSGERGITLCKPHSMCYTTEISSEVRYEASPSALDSNSAKSYN